ncbi:MAG: hypothetical protein C0448_12240 [Sphingobacteriaceae bacterium]|nr:hypothetical protein [Sphingobacteriaceae bacterium]
MTSKKNMLLFIVENKFAITDRGLILTPGLGDKVKLVETGSKIKLVRPDKTEIETKITGIGFEGNHDIIISSEITTEQIPIGTEVWTVE